MTRLALFDLDNTLVDRSAAVARVVTTFIAEHGLDEAEHAWLMSADGNGYVPRDQFCAAIRERYGLAAPVEELVSAFRRGVVEALRCEPETLDGLAELRAEGWRLGIVTNGDALQQETKILALGLDGYVDGWAISGAEDIRKPDVRLFATAAARCGVELGSGGWFIGDNPSADIGGGRAAGLRTIWVQTPGSDWPDGAADAGAPDHTVRNVAAAIGIVLNAPSE